MPTFIRNIEFFTPDGYPGGGALPFTLAEYRDDSFPEAGFALPDHLARAVPKRRAEYLAGRVLARQLLAPLGFADFTWRAAKIARRSGRRASPGR